MSARVVVRLTHAQAHALAMLARVHADDEAEQGRDRGVFRRGGQAIEVALAAQAERRRARADVTP